MQRSQLEFIQTFTIRQYLQQTNATRLDVKQNPHNDKLFFVTDVTEAGKAEGAVSNSDLGDDPSISKVRNEKGEEFFLLHKTSSENTVRSFSLD